MLSETRRFYLHRRRAATSKALFSVRVGHSEAQRVGAVRLLHRH